MKNFLMIACAAVCTLLMASNTSYAIGGGGSGGKTASSARVVMTNTLPAGGIGIAAWVRLAGTPVPSTIGALRNQLIFMGPGETRNTNNLRNGTYIITTINVATLNSFPDSTQISAADIAPPVIIDSETFVINGVDRSANLNAAGISFLN